eukprot:5205722-Heterocapsa_arctica.AAC.1
MSHGVWSGCRALSTRPSRRTRVWRVWSMIMRHDMFGQMLGGASSQTRRVPIHTVFESRMQRTVMSTMLLVRPVSPAIRE